MKDHGYAHRDLKPENIAVAADYSLKIIDWGFATPYQSGLVHNTRLGTLSYMAPEIYKGSSYDAHLIDMFAIGVILFVSIVGRYPWHEPRSSDDYFGYFTRGQPSQFWAKWSRKLANENVHIDPELIDLLNGLFTTDLSQRLTVE